MTDCPYDALLALFDISSPKHWVRAVGDFDIRGGYHFANVEALLRFEVFK